MERTAILTVIRTPSEQMFFISGAALVLACGLVTAPVTVQVNPTSDKSEKYHAVA